jgi:uncharacterized glyoxalase superfamily protein PhnB
VPVPPRYARVDPWVISSDTEAEIAFLETAFDAQETLGSRMLGPDGRIGHIEVELGESVMMLFDAQPEWRPTPAHLRVYVADTQETFDRAVAAGARPVTHPTELAFGERVARVRDPQGHLWWIHRSRMLRLPSWADASPTHRRNKHWPTSSSPWRGSWSEHGKDLPSHTSFRHRPAGLSAPGEQVQGALVGQEPVT